MGSTAQFRTVRQLSDSTLCTGSRLAQKNSNGSLIHDSFRKEWEAALEAKRTVSASNRKVSLSREEHLIVNGAKISNPKILGEGEKD